MTLGKLYGIGVGPGDPELLTIKAVNVLRRVRYVFAPLSAPGSDSVALTIARQYVGEQTVVEQVAFPMVTDRATLMSRWDAAAQKVLSVLEQGDDACFLTLGDPLLYSTYIYLLRSLRRRLPELCVETVPGITAFSAVAALTEFPIGEGKQPVRIVPTADDLTAVQQALAAGGTVVLMKIGRRLNAILKLLTEADLIERAVLVARAGMSGQRIETDLRNLKEEDSEVGYLAVILVNATREGIS